MPTFSAQRLEEIAPEILTAAGALEHEAQVVAHSLVEANLMGHDSHGVLRVPWYVSLIKDGQVRPGARLEVVMDTPQMALIDGHWGFGQVVARRAGQICLDKAREHGIGVVSVRECGHMGRAGEYVEMAAEQGMVGLAMLNSHGAGQVVAPYGGIARKLAPNVIACAIPTGGEAPMVVDITTSSIAGGKAWVCRNRGEPLPPGSAIDAHGRPTTDPAAFYGPPPGALLPFGGALAHKGYALMLMADIFAGAFSGAGCTREDAWQVGNAFFLLVVDPARFRPLEDFQREVRELATYVKDSPTAAGFEEILVPGEVEHRTKQQRLRDGIPLDEETWGQLVETAEKLGLHFPKAETYRTKPSKFLAQTVASARTFDQLPPVD